MNAVKPAIQSTSIWGGLIAALGPFVGPVLTTVIPILPPQWQVVVSGATSVLGGLMAIYGRATATSAISGVISSK